MGLRDWICLMKAADSSTVRSFMSSGREGRGWRTRALRAEFGGSGFAADSSKEKRSFGVQLKIRQRDSMSEMERVLRFWLMRCCAFALVKPL